MKYSSEELNKKIRDICDRDDLEIEGGKCVPYIGWFWRDVNFDHKYDSSRGYQFGIIYKDCSECGHKSERYGIDLVGFMENNKWDYENTEPLKQDEWEKVKNMLCNIVDNPTRENTKELWDYIQTFGRR